MSGIHGGLRNSHLLDATFDEWAEVRMDALRLHLSAHMGGVVEVAMSENGEDDWILPVYASYGNAYALCDLGRSDFMNQVEFMEMQLKDSME